jgi:hypothetical protein
MKTIKLNDLMGLERLLLEIDIKYKFDLSFNDVYMLHRYLGNVGKITSYFFFIQDEFYKKYNDTDKLKEYHNKLINDSIEFDYDDIIKFIENVLNTHGDHEFQALVETVKFWK